MKTPSHAFFSSSIVHLFLSLPLLLPPESALPLLLCSSLSSALANIACDLIVPAPRVCVLSASHSLFSGQNQNAAQSSDAESALCVSSDCGFQQEVGISSWWRISSLVIFYCLVAQNEHIISVGVPRFLAFHILHTPRYFNTCPNSKPPPL